jgi:branched-chain amino acid transport system ATP-binding protein
MLLETKDLTVRFGGVVANNALDMKVDTGQLVGLIGPNGAGKTTFIDALTGFVRSTGAITFDGERIDQLAPHKRAKVGLSRTWQSLELFDDLSVRENLQVASETPRLLDPVLDLVRPRRGHDAAAIERALDLLGLSAAAERMPSELSQGQRKMVSAARALAADPRLVLMDEPAAGLDSNESRALGLQLRGLLGAGLTILLVDHDMGLILEVCDFIYVIDFGSVIAAGTPAEIRRDESVIKAYLGERSRGDGTTLEAEA